MFGAVSFLTDNEIEKGGEEEVLEEDFSEKLKHILETLKEDAVKGGVASGAFT